VRSRYGYLAAALAWFLYINGEQFFRYDASRIAAHQFTMDGGLSACVQLRDYMKNFGINAECRELI
jgi:hypothetical protein